MGGANMNISEVNIGLKGEDLESIIKEFLEIKELKIYSININEEITIKGNFKKIISIDFEGKLKIKKYNEGKVEAELIGFKISKIKIVKFIRKVILKFALKTLEDKGISYNKGKVIIDIKKLMLDVPYVDFDIKDIYTKEDKIHVQADNIQVSIKGLLKKEYKEEVIEEDKEVEEVITELNKVTDGYTKGREFAISNMPNKALNIKDYIFIIPDIVALIYRLLKDKRVPVKTKLVIAAAVSYITFPIDLIPNKIPFVGTIDEIGMAFFAINKIINDVDMKVILENWEGKNDIIFVMKNLVEYVTNFTGAKNVEKVYNFIDEVVSV